MSGGAVRGAREHDRPGSYGALILHAENPVRGVRRRTARWALLVALGLVSAGVAVLYVVGFGEPGHRPPWWLYGLSVPAVALLGWGFWECFGLLSAWRHAGWAVDVYREGVVESRFASVRQAMPFSGGVLDLHGVPFTSPNPRVGPGRLDAPWRGELPHAVAAVRATAQRVLVRETLARLRSGRAVAFPGRRSGSPGITLSPHALTLPDGREYEYSSIRMRYSVSDGTGDVTAADDPARADTLGFVADDAADGLPGLSRTSPNLAVVREVLHRLVDPEGHEKHSRRAPEAGGHTAPPAERSQ